MNSRRHVVNVIALVASALALCAWCGWLSGFHRSTFPARVTWPFSLAAVVVVDVLLWQGRRGHSPGLRLKPVDDPWPRPGRGGGRPAFKGLLPWLVFTLVILTWEILGIDTPKDRYHLTIERAEPGFPAAQCCSTAPVDARRVRLRMGSGQVSCWHRTVDGCLRAR